MEAPKWSILGLPRVCTPWMLRAVRQLMLNCLVLLVWSPYGYLLANHCSIKTCALQPEIAGRIYGPAQVYVRKSSNIWFHSYRRHIGHIIDWIPAGRLHRAGVGGQAFTST